tara:strand:+ start:99 stop:545 length:447 start_codon:yes stop_codon:yes gene_type:complete
MEVSRMDFEYVVPFLKWNHKAVVSTNRPGGSVHSSVVVCGTSDGHVSFVSVYPRSQKIANLRRDPQCTISCVGEDWRSYVVIEGKSTLYGYDNTDSESMRIKLREVYMSCSDTPHPDWDNYDAAMITQRAVIVLVCPERIYGLNIENS